MIQIIYISELQNSKRLYNVVIIYIIRSIFIYIPTTLWYYVIAYNIYWMSWWYLWGLYQYRDYIQTRRARNKRNPKRAAVAADVYTSFLPSSSRTLARSNVYMYKRLCDSHRRYILTVFASALCSTYIYIINEALYVYISDDELQSARVA